MERSDAPEGSGFMRRRKPANGSTVSRFPQTPTGCISGPGAISFIFIMAALRQLPRMLRTEELSEEEEEESSVFITVPAAQLDKMQRQLPLLQEHFCRYAGTVFPTRTDNLKLMFRTDIACRTEQKLKLCPL